MAWEGLSYWEDWPAYLEAADERGLVRFIRCGGVFLGNDERYTEKVLPLFDQIGVPYEIWDIDTLRARIPGIDVGRHSPPKRVDDDAFWDEPAGTFEKVVYTSAAGYVADPQLAAHNLQRAAEAKGATFRFRTEVTGIGTADNRVTGVELGDGSFVAAPIVVNVAGPHSFVVNEMAGLTGSMRISTRALRHEVHHVPSPVGLDFERDGYLVGDDDLGVYFRPEVGNNILVGSQDPECDPKEWVHPDDLDRNLTSEAYDNQVLRLARRLPALGVPQQKRGVADLYDVSDDWIPIYDRSDLDGFYLAIGTSGNQFKNASVASYCMTRLIEQIEAGHDHDADPVRVTQRYTGLELDMGAFSRNREIHEGSSFSVIG